MSDGPSHAERFRKKEQRRERLALCQELPLIQGRLFRCGLLETGHAMDEAVKAIGFEVEKGLRALQHKEMEDEG